MEQTSQELNIILTLFPSYESWLTFKDSSENQEIIDSLVFYAKTEGVLREGTREELDALIRCLSRGTRVEPDNLPLNFSDLLERRKEFLGLQVSVRTWVRRVNDLLDKYGLSFPRISNTMLTRLKREAADTVYKQNVLRSIAFWLGHERPQMVPSWNYEVLRKLCETGAAPGYRLYTHGIRIGFALYGRGDVVDHEVVGWLKKTLKEYLENSKDPYLHGRRVRGHDITTLYVDFPREGEADHPSAYRYCLRSAISLAHQVAVRWSLSPYYSEKRFLSIGLAGGDFSTIDSQLLPILNVRIPGDPVIRLTDFIRQCLLINDVRVILCEYPQEVTLFNGETLFVWWVYAFWNTIYFDFIPDLLTDPILGTSEEAHIKLNSLLFCPDQLERRKANAVTTFLRFPSNSLLGQEIAKTLYFRRKFWEALEVMRIVVGLNPNDPTARTFRMVLYRHLALMASSWEAANPMIRFALQEARYVEDHCKHLGEDFYCEYAGTYLTRAILALRFSRRGEQREREFLQEKVFESLHHAALLYNKGRAASPSGIRSTFLLHMTIILRAILRDNPFIITDSSRRVLGRRSLVRKVSGEVMRQGGFIRDDIPGVDPDRFAEDRMIINFELHDGAVALEASRPTTYFCHAVALWDFSVIRRVATARRVHKILTEARRIAATLAKKDICVFSYTRICEEMLPVSEFIEHIDRAINLIETRVGEALKVGRDDLIIPEEEGYEPLLMTLNFYEERDYRTEKMQEDLRWETG